MRNIPRHKDKRSLLRCRQQIRPPLRPRRPPQGHQQGPPPQQKHQVIR
ncbi:mucin-associated surface protein (MASP), putative, partial [Trypanosoma cruzi marinkellei]